MVYVDEGNFSTNEDFSEAFSDFRDSLAPILMPSESMVTKKQWLLAFIFRKFRHTLTSV